MRTQQHRQRPVPLGEVRARAAVQDHAHVAAGLRGRLGQLGQRQQQVVIRKAMLPARAAETLAVLLVGIVR